MSELKLTEEQLFDKMLDWVFMWDCYDYSKAEFEPKEHVLDKLKEQSKPVTPPVPVPERKPVPGCCFEREITGW